MSNLRRRSKLTEDQVNDVIAKLQDPHVQEEISRRLTELLESKPAQESAAIAQRIKRFVELLKSITESFISNAVSKVKEAIAFAKKYLVEVIAIVAGAIGVLASGFLMIIGSTAAAPAGTLAALAAVLSIWLVGEGLRFINQKMYSESRKMKKNKLTESQMQEIVAKLNDPNFQKRCAEAIAAKIQSLPKAEAEALLEELKAFALKFGAKNESVLREGVFRYIKTAFIIIAGMIGISITAFLALWSQSIAGLALGLAVIFLMAAKTIESSMSAMGAFDRRTESAAVQIANTKRKLEEALSGKKKIDEWGLFGRSGKDDHEDRIETALNPKNLRKKFPNGIKALNIEKEEDTGHGGSRPNGWVTFNIDLPGGPVFYIDPKYIGLNDIIQTENFIEHAKYSGGR